MAQGRGGGRKPLPDYIRVIKGSGRKGRPPNRSAAVPRPSPGLPEVPSFLTAAARREWDRIAGELYAIGLLTKLDMAVLSAYCTSYARWQMCEAALKRKRSLVTESPSGYAMTDPLVSIARRAAADTVKYAAELGLTPIARIRLAGVEPPPPTDDPSGKYFD